MKDALSVFVCQPACLCLSVCGSRNNSEYTSRSLKSWQWFEDEGDFCRSKYNQNPSERRQAVAFYPHRIMSDLSIIVAAIFTIVPFSVMFEKLRKANINFVISICPSIRSHARLPPDGFS